MTTPANPDDLNAWLREQVDEDEATTRELLYWAQQTILTLQDPKLLGKHIPGWHDWPKVERMCRVRLAEVDAKRRILDLHVPWQSGYMWVDADTRVPDLRCSVCHDIPADVDYDNPAYAVEFPCPTLRLLALPYADRPGYREEWRPA